MGLLFSLLGAFCLALLNLVTKALVNKSKSPLAIAFAAQVLTGMIFLPIILFEEVKFSPDPLALVLLFAAILLYVIISSTTYTANKYLDISYGGIISQLSLIFSFIGAMIVFKEALVVARIVGVVLILMGNVLIFIPQKTQKVKISTKGVVLRLIGALGIGIGGLVDAKNMEFYSVIFYSFIIWLMPGIFVGIAAWKTSGMKVILEDISRLKYGLLLNSLFGAGATFFIFTAYKIEEKTVVFPILSLSIIILVILSILFLKEYSNVKMKIIASILAFIGALFIGLG